MDLSAQKAAPVKPAPPVPVVVTPVVAPAATPAPVAKAMAPAPRRRSRASEDARACLDLPNTVSIVKCAEKFL